MSFRNVLLASFAVVIEIFSCRHANTSSTILLHRGLAVPIMIRTMQVPLDRNSYWQEEYEELPNVCGASIHLPHHGYLLADGTG